jgi:hypothetical protein
MAARPPTLASIIDLMRLTYRDTRALAERLPDQALRGQATLIADRLLRMLTRFDAAPTRRPKPHREP